MKTTLHQVSPRKLLIHFMVEYFMLYVLFYKYTLYYKCQIKEAYLQTQRADQSTFATCNFEYVLSVE